MPPRARATEPDETTADESTASGHVVLTDMLTYTVKGRRPGTLTAVRAPKGTLVQLDPDLNDIGYLEDLKAIGPDDGTKYRRTTAKVLAEAAGGLEDPVPVPENLFEVTDEDVTAGELTEEDDEPEDHSTPADDE